MNTVKNSSLIPMSSYSKALLCLITLSSLPFNVVRSFTNYIPNRVDIPSHSESSIRQCSTTKRLHSSPRLNGSKSKDAIESLMDKIKSSSLNNKNNNDSNNNDNDSNSSSDIKNTDDKKNEQPPLVVKEISDERREYELNVGKALDTLKSDYPKIFQSCPDFSIYHSSLEVKDPSGVTLHGINNYKNFFRVLRAIVSFIYCADKSSITFRLVYDWARGNIRVSWHAMLIPKSIYGGVRNPLYVDGVSIYETDRMGIIVQHRVEQLMLNGSPAAFQDGLWNAVTNEAQGIPVLGVEGAALDIMLRNNDDINHILAFSGEAATSSSDSFNKESFDQRNSYRKKYGLKPLTPEEFADVEAKTRILEQETELRREQLSAAQQAKQNQRNKKGLFSDLFTDTCESNFDCQRPEVCCDFIVKKICCASGLKVANYGPGDVRGNPALVPVPARPDNGFPDGPTARY